MSKKTTLTTTSGEVPNPKRDENDQSTAELEQLLTEANKTPIAKISPQETKQEWHTPSEIQNIINQLADTMGLDTHTAFIAIALLFLKGAANKGTPTTMSVAVMESSNQTEVSKSDLIYVYRKNFKNIHIRRLAESMAVLISRYAEAQGLSGDLAKKINISLLKKKEATLTRKEAAWCSSFCQSNPKVEEVSERLAGLLSEDYLTRFQTSPNNSRGKKASPQNPQNTKGAKGTKEVDPDQPTRKK